MSARDGAVDWHERIAEEFSDGYRRSPAFIERRRLWERLIAAHVGRDDEVLDAGCGAGTFSLIAAARCRTVTGFDGSPGMIAIAERERLRFGVANARFEVAMLDSLDLRPAAAFDVVLCSSVLEYVEDLERELARLTHVLKPGGRLIVSMPNAGSLYRKAEALMFRLTKRPRYFAHVRHVVSAESMALRLAGLGLDVRSVDYFADPPAPLGALLDKGARGKTLFAMVAVKRC